MTGATTRRLVVVATAAAFVRPDRFVLGGSTMDDRTASVARFQS